MLTSPSIEVQYMELSLSIFAAFYHYYQEIGNEKTSLIGSASSKAVEVRASIKILSFSPVEGKGSQSMDSTDNSCKFSDNFSQSSACLIL